MSMDAWSRSPARKASQIVRCGPRKKVYREHYLPSVHIHQQHLPHTLRGERTDGETVQRHYINT